MGSNLKELADAACRGQTLHQTKPTIQKGSKQQIKKSERERERTERAGKNVCKWPDLMRSPLVNLNVISSSLPLISGFGQWSVPPNSAESVKDSELRRLLAAHMERLSVCMVRLGQKGAARSNQIQPDFTQIQPMSGPYRHHQTSCIQTLLKLAMSLGKWRRMLPNAVNHFSL